MAFHFRFEQLLFLAEHEETEEKNRLARKDAQIAETSTKIAEIEEKFDATLDAKAQDLLAGNLARLGVYEAFFSRLESERAYYEDEIERFLKQREKLLEILTEKRRTRLTYQKLRERDEFAYRKAEEKRDQKNMDEFAGRIPRGDKQHV